METRTLSGKILVADDAAMDRARLASVVRSIGCEAIEVAYADQVVEIASQQQPTMILMDVIMGPPNGFEVCRLLRENPETSHIPVVLCSVKSTKVDHDWARRQGAMGYLAKPIDPAKTRDFLLRQWDRFQAASEQARAREEKQQRAAAALSMATQAHEALQAQALKEQATKEQAPGPKSEKPSLGWTQVGAARAQGVDGDGGASTQ